MKSLLMTIMCLTIVMFYGVLAGSSETGENQAEDTLCIPLGDLLLEPPEGVEQKRASVDFPHSRHFSYSCQTCHHTWDGNTEILSCTTSGCHDLIKSPLKSAKSAADEDLLIRYYKRAYHKNCIDCHKEIKRKNKEMEMSLQASNAKILKTGPTSCIQCHPKDE